MYALVTSKVGTLCERSITVWEFAAIFAIALVTERVVMKRVRCGENAPTVSETATLAAVMEIASGITCNLRTTENNVNTAEAATSLT